MATCVLERPSSATALTRNQFASRWEIPAQSSAACVGPYSSRESAYRVVHRESIPPSWVEPTILALNAIHALPHNWDSYGAKPVNSDFIYQSLLLLGAVMQMSSPTPSVVPLGDGGIQIEWHRRQQDLEVVFSADEPAQFYYRNRATGARQEGLANQISDLVKLLGDLA
jgi:hypothetical protein